MSVDDVMRQVAVDIAPDVLSSRAAHDYLVELRDEILMRIEALEGDMERGTEDSTPDR